MTKKMSMEYVSIPIKALLFITLLQMLSQQAHLPIWLSIFALMVCSLRYLTHKRLRHGVPFLLRIVLVIISSAVFIMYFRTNFSVDMAASFLFLACILKLLEIRTHKDVVIFIFTMFYLTAVSFLFEQGIIHSLLEVCVVAYCFYVLFILQFDEVSITQSHYKLVKMHSKSMFKLLALALPFVAILFLFFPRISPLWQMPIKSQVSQTGMSNEMSPGDVSKLAKSSEPAFRATFEYAAPNRSSLYWRGLVLDEFDGRQWRQSAERQRFERATKVDPGRFYDTKYPAYQVMLEPHQQKWVFALEGSQLASSNVKETDMGLFALKTEAIQATRYQMEIPPSNKLIGVPNIPTAFSLKQVKRVTSYPRQDLQVPMKVSNPKTQDYIRQLQRKYPSDEQILVHLLKLFQEDVFFYTMEPPLTGEHFVDEFMFETKSGFCEHYAGSLAYMLRLAGIPARVVVGYQGGEYNEQSDYMLISQYDAHAWVEAFLPEKGWLRLDPTAMVSPLRISDGSMSSLLNERTFMQDSPFASAAMRYSILNWVRLRIDEINFKWQSLVVNYNQDQQNSFISKTLGENSLLRIALFFIYLFITFFVLAMLYFWLQSLSGYTRAEKKYMVWLFVLSKFGYKRQKGETPRLFLQRVQKSKYKKLAEITARRTEQLEVKQYRE